MEKKNIELHRLFKSVPEKDILLEGNLFYQRQYSLPRCKKIFFCKENATLLKTDYAFIQILLVL